MTSEFAMDAAATAVVFGFAAAAWFGWAQEAPPPRWRRPLAVGALVGVATAGFGGLRLWRDSASPTTAADASSTNAGMMLIRRPIVPSPVSRLFARAAAD